MRGKIDRVDGNANRSYKKISRISVSDDMRSDVFVFVFVFVSNSVVEFSSFYRVVVTRLGLKCVLVSADDVNTSKM